MRAWMLALTVSFFVAMPLRAQPREGSGSSPARLQELLRGWETKSRAMRDVQCEFQRVSTDAVFKTDVIEYGKASGIKPYLGRLDLMDEKGKFTQIFIYDGKALHQYDFKTKQVIEHVLPEMARDKSLPGPLGFVYGMTAAEAQARFQLTLAREFVREGVEYAELHATPKTEIDQQEFKVAKIVIEKKTYLPKQLRIEEPNGNRQDWIFSYIETNVDPPVSAESLTPLKTPKDWKRIVNKYGEPPSDGAASKARPASGTTKPRTDATRPATPKR